MKYQLVLQWASESLIGGFDTLVEIENVLQEKLGKQEDVDRQDDGPGEVNIFILTDDTLTCFERVKSILDWSKEWGSVRVSYQEILGNEFVILFPKSLTKFRIA